MIERKTLKLVLLWRRNGDVHIGPAIGGCQRLVECRAQLSKDAPIAQSLFGSFTSVTWIENKRAFDLHPETTVTTKFQAKRTAFERVHTLEQDHQVEPQNG